MTTTATRCQWLGGLSATALAARSVFVAREKLLIGNTDWNLMLDARRLHRPPRTSS